MPDALIIRLDGRSPGWLAAARALVRDAGHRPWSPADGPPDVVLAEERLVGLPPGALGVVAAEVGDGLRARLEALLRRPATLEVPLVDGRVDLAGERVLRASPQPLTAVEAALLRRLVRAEGRTVPRADLLRDVWGVGPGVQTRALDTAVRRLRAKIEPDRRRPRHLLTAHGVGYRFVPAPAPDPPPHALGPTPDGPLFGREAACVAVERALAGRWVTLVGPGGVGKSRLARACAERLLLRFRPGGAWLCDLSPCADREAAATAVARALGLPGASAGLADALAARGPTLLVLDDIDRVAPALGPLVAEWLAAAPTLAVIATGRRAAGHPAETTWAPGPLEARDAAALFRHRAGLDDPAIAPLVALLDHLPLAITLAADRARLLPPAALLDRLRDPAAHVALLSRPGDARREGAVDRVLAASWALLDPVQRRVAARCAVFRGPFTAEDAERICAEPGTLDALHGLVALSVLRRVEPGRLALFETIRCWLAARIEDADETAARHRAWCVALAEAFAVAPMAERARRFAATAAARHDLRAAFAHPGLAPSERAALAVALSAVFARTGPFAVARQAARVDAGPDPVWSARLACARARHGVRQGSPAEGFAALAASLADADALPVAVRAGVMLDAARCAPSAERSAALAEAADRLFAEAGDPVGQAAARMVRSRLAYRAGRADLAMGHALRATDAYRRAGVDDLLAPALANLALTFTRQSSWPEARRCADEARRVAERIGDGATEAVAVAVEGYIALHHADFDAAAAQLDEAVRRQRALALRGVALQNRLLAGLATALGGRLEAGRRAVDEAAAEARSTPLGPLAEACSAALAALAGEQALARHRAAERRRGDDPTPPTVAEATRLFWAAVDAADDGDRAARLLAEADARATTELTVRCARWLLALRLAPRQR